MIIVCRPRSARTAEPGAYDFGVNDESGTLAPLKFIVGDLPEVTEAEPNDTVAQSQPLNGAVTVNGRMDRDGDEDLFRISAEAGLRCCFKWTPKNMVQCSTLPLPCSTLRAKYWPPTMMPSGWVAH